MRAARLALSLPAVLAPLGACFWMAVGSATAWAQRLDPATISFPWMNGETADAVYALADYPDAVHVFEAFTINCSGCSANVVNVHAMARAYAADPRVRFVDLGVDADSRDHRRWIARHRPVYPVVKDVNQRVYNALTRSGSIPQAFVIDCNGELIDAVEGVWGSEAKSRIRRAIDKALGTVCD